MPGVWNLPRLSVFHISFPGHWMGGDAIVVASSEEEALALFAEDPAIKPLLPKAREEATATIVDTYAPAVHVLDNGDY